MSFKSFFFGEPGGMEQVSTLTPQQQPLFQQYLRAVEGRGAGGAMGEVADYYRDILSDQSSTLDAMIAPEMRRFQEQTIPSLAEQFAGLGSGALSSSGFQQAGAAAGADLGERIANIRAQLRQQAASGLSGLGQGAFTPVQENIYKQPTSGFLDAVGQGLGQVGGQAAAAYLGMPPMAAMQQSQSGFGKSSPFGNAPQTQSFQAPQFQYRV